MVLKEMKKGTVNGKATEGKGKTKYENEKRVKVRKAK